MPVHDFRCEQCAKRYLDVFHHDLNPTRTCVECGGVCVHLWTGKASGVQSDECDVWAKHGICNDDGTPRHYRFKSEMKAEAKRRGLEQHVVHKGGKEGDRSPHTSRWI